MNSFTFKMFDFNEVNLINKIFMNTFYIIIFT